MNTEAFFKYVDLFDTDFLHDVQRFERPQASFCGDRGLSELELRPLTGFCFDGMRFPAVLLLSLFNFRGPLFAWLFLLRELG